ncbi:MAG: hypothetical protein ACYDBH_05510 [Acidobacteriaceae bacterium]
MAIRIRPRQEELFADGSREKHFVVLSNIWEWNAERLIQWHREKAGTIEAVHDVLKNELAGGVMPSKYFGLAAAGGDRAQRADGSEAHRVAGGIIAGATEAAAFPDHQHGRAVGATCAENAAASGRIGRAYRPMEGSHATAASRYMREGSGTRIDGFS